MQCVYGNRPKDGESMEKKVQDEMNMGTYGGLYGIRCLLG